MEFRFTEDQRMIRDTARAFLSERGGLRAALEAGEDAAFWHEAAELGWLGVALPEAHGGSGLGMVELAILMQETGRVLAMAPFFTTAGLAAPAIQAVGTAAQQAALLPGIARGETKTAMCLTGASGRPAPAELTVLEDGVLNGAAHYVAWGHAADLLLVAARAPGSTGWEGVSLLALPAGTPGLVVTREVSMDLTRPYATVRFENLAVPQAAMLGAPGQAGPGLRNALAIGAILLAAEQLGGAERALELSVAFAKQRIQFGRPIGSFQAIKHILADMMLLVESARSAAFYAACAAEQLPEELEEAAAIARATCTDAFTTCAAQAIQVHGGVGFTWEYDAHLYFKRARSSATLLGDAAFHRERLAEILGL